MLQTPSVADRIEVGNRGVPLSSCLAHNMVGNSCVVTAPFVTIQLASGRQIKVKQAAATFGLASTGNVLWEGSKFLARLVEDQYGDGCRDRPLEGKAVLELGAGGCGVPGIVAWMLGASVTWTDLASQLPLLQENLRLNGVSGARVTVTELDWKRQTAPLPATCDGKKFDLVLHAECLYADTTDAVARATLHFLRPAAATAGSAAFFGADCSLSSRIGSSNLRNGEGGGGSGGGGSCGGGGSGDGGSCGGGSSDGNRECGFAAASGGNAGVSCGGSKRPLHAPVGDTTWQEESGRAGVAPRPASFHSASPAYEEERRGCDEPVRSGERVGGGRDDCGCEDSSANRAGRVERIDGTSNDGTSNDGTSNDGSSNGVSSRNDGGGGGPVALVCNTNRRAVHLFRRRLREDATFERIILPGMGDGDIAWRLRAKQRSANSIGQS
ncbi:unnamed protein product [Phaeothamnion confervicola]